MGQQEILNSLREGRKEISTIAKELKVRNTTVSAGIRKLKKWYNIVTEIVQEGSRQRYFHTLVE